MGMEPVQQCPEINDQNSLQKTKKEVSYGVLNGKKDDKLILTTQYLMDNVLGAVSEARLQLKMRTQGNKPTLKQMIEQLKKIYARGNY